MEDKKTEKKWPLRPICITNDGPQSQDSELTKLTGQGIISNEHLQGIETAVCAKLEVPTTIVEFSPSGKGVKTDSHLLKVVGIPFGAHPPCHTLRSEISPDYCNKCDIEHASIFQGLCRENLPEIAAKRKEESEYIKNYQQQVKEIHCNLNTATRRPYLEYDCPLLGYREVAFPIFFENSVVGVLFIGQICLKNKKSLISRIRNRFFRSIQKYQSAKKQITQKHNKWVSNNNHIFDDNTYEAKKKITCTELDKLENTLKEQMERQRNLYVKEKIDAQLKYLRDKFFDKKQGDKNTGLKPLWSRLTKCMDQLIEDFNLEYILVFELEREWQENLSKLMVVASSGDLPVVLKDCLKSLEFNVMDVLEDLRTRYVMSNDEPQILEGLKNFPDEIKKESYLLHFLPVPFLEESAAVVLIGCKELSPLSSPQKEAWRILQEQIQPFYQVVISASSAIQANIAKRNLSNSFLVLGHEKDNFSYAADMMCNNYLRNAQTLKQLSDDELDFAARHIKQCLKHLDTLYTQARMLVEGPSKVNKEYFWIYEAILYQLPELFELEQREKKLWFDIAKTTKSNLQYPRVYGHRVYLKHLIYNLVRNAVKYCHRGTQIKVECNKCTSGNMLSVINYGREFKCEHPFDLHTRGTNVDGLDGLGFGLTIAQRVAECHNSNLAITRDEKVSDFNVPVIEPYLKSDFPKRDEKLIPVLKEELKRLKNSGEYQQIVAHSAMELRLYNPEGYELTDFINLPTYKVTIGMRIPGKGG